MLARQAPSLCVCMAGSASPQLPRCQTNRGGTFYQLLLQLPAQLNHFICKNCTWVIWGQVESCFSKIETSALPYALRVPMEVEIIPCRSKNHFEVSKLYLGDLGPSRKLLLKNRNFSFTLRFVSSGGSQNLSLQIEWAISGVKLYLGDLGPNRKLLVKN